MNFNAFRKSGGPSFWQLAVGAGVCEFCLRSIEMEPKPQSSKKRARIQFWCCVPSCACSYKKNIDRNLSFFTVPDPTRSQTIFLQQLAKKRLKRWREAIGSEIKPGARICQWHFLNGRACRRFFDSSFIYRDIFWFDLKGNQRAWPALEMSIGFHRVI